MDNLGKGLRFQNKGCKRVVRMFPSNSTVAVAVAAKFETLELSIACLLFTKCNCVRFIDENVVKGAITCIIGYGVRGQSANS